MKIMLAYFARFINSTGGAEAVCCRMANELAARGHEVVIAYCCGKSGRPLFPLDGRVEMRNLMVLHPEKWKGAMVMPFPNSYKVVREALRIFSVNKAHGWQERYMGKRIAEEIKETVEREKPDVIVSYWPKDSNYLINFAKVTVPVVTMFHIEPEILAKDASEGSRAACAASKKVQVLLKGDIVRLKKYIPDANAVWIPNEVRQFPHVADLTAEKETYTVLSMGRLDKTTKRQHILIEAFAELADRFPAWRVEIYGEAWNPQYKKELEEKIRRFHLEGRVHLRGFTQKPQEKYLAADIFAWPSAHEGFGLALAEAMSAGLPVVACKKCTASAELVSPRSGILVGEGAHAFAEGLAALMEDKEKRAAMGVAAREEMAAYAPERVWDTWEEVLTEAAGKTE